MPREAIDQSDQQGNRWLQAAGCCAECVLLALGLLLLWRGPHQLTGDGQLRFESVKALLATGKPQPMPYSLIGPLGAALFWRLSQSADDFHGWCARYNFFLFILGLAALAAILWRPLGAATMRRFLLLLVFGSMFPRHVQDFYGEVFTAVLVGAGLAAVAGGRTGWPWLLVLAGTTNTPASLPALGLVSLERSVVSRRLRYLALVLAGAALITGENWLRRGNPFATGYEDNRGFENLLPYSGLPGFSYPLFFGLLSALFSFGKGVVFFAPGLCVGIPTLANPRQSVATTYRLWLIFLVGLILVYARWWSWYGGWFWGPRFFLFASLPASLALALRLERPTANSLVLNVALLGALGLSFWVGANGLVFDQASFERFLDQRRLGFVAVEYFFWYVPECSALWIPFVVPKPLSTADWLTLGGFAAAFVVVALPTANAIVRSGWQSLRSQHLGSRWRF